MFTGSTSFVYRNGHGKIDSATLNIVAAKEDTRADNTVLCALAVDVYHILGGWIQILANGRLKGVLTSIAGNQVHVTGLYRTNDNGFTGIFRSTNTIHFFHGRFSLEG